MHERELGALVLRGADAGDFTLSNDTCSKQTRVQDARGSFQITLTPSATSARSAVVDVPSNAPSGADIVTLTGTGIPLTDDIFSHGFEGP
ncbi:MAG TPA: hypothetical protein VN581_12715 [Patescibacteria group bacterium]|nr:hypothetical protein [Patescibacteria group bacterium]